MAQTRTGRLFTGDRSGDVLYAGLHREGFASQAHSVARNDGLTLRDVYISVAARCAPRQPAHTGRAVDLPGVSPSRAGLLTRLRVVIALGAIAHQAAWLALTSDEKQDHPAPKMPKVWPRTRASDSPKPVVDRAARADAHRQLPRLAAQHVYGAYDKCDARRHLAAGPATRRLKIDPLTTTDRCCTP